MQEKGDHFPKVLGLEQIRVNLDVGFWPIAN